MRGARAAVLFLAGLLCGGCPNYIAQMCPRCEPLLADRAPRIEAGTERVYVLLPGILGYDWEWNGVQIALAQVPRSRVLVLEWRPWGSLHAGGVLARAALQRLLKRLPPSAREVVVMGHSVGGLVLVLAAAELEVPAGVVVRALTIGAPFAGTHLTIFDFPAPLHTPSPFAIGGTFARWPAPAPGVSLEVYPTTWPNDPVMRPRMGYDPAQRAALPPGARLLLLPPGIDHNVAATWVAERLLEEARAGSAGQGAGAPP